MKKYRQSGVIPYCYIDNKLHIYLITSMGKGNWIVPKGIVEEENDEIETGIIETYEEAGLIGVVEDTIVGSYTVQKWGGVCKVNLYPMKVLITLDQWPEDRQRKRCCIEAKKVPKLISREDLSSCIKKWIHSVKNR